MAEMGSATTTMLDLITAAEDRLPAAGGSAWHIGCDDG